MFPFAIVQLVVNLFVHLIGRMDARKEGSREGSCECGTAAPVSRDEYRGHR